MKRFAALLKISPAPGKAALSNTAMYLSVVGDLDVYIATSMRNRADFRVMADLCDTVFSNDQLQALKLRYFDPTLSAAEHHEDKGVIECLMVKMRKGTHPKRWQP